MGSTFLDQVHTGRNEWWRYLLAGLAMLSALLVLSPILMAMVVVANHGNPLPAADPITGGYPGIDPLVGYLAAMVPAVALLGGLYVAVEFVHGRRLISLATPQRTVSWGRMAQGFGVWAALAAASLVVACLAQPAGFRLAFDARRLLPLLLVAPLLTPLGASVQELFFRGYLMQATSLLSERPLPVIALSSLVFALAHRWNPELSGSRLLLLYYLVVGVFYAALSLRDDGLELAIGAHTAIILFAALFANYENSVVPTPALFTFARPDALPSLLAFGVEATIFWLCFFGPRRLPKPRLGRKR